MRGRLGTLLAPLSFTCNMYVTYLSCFDDEVLLAVAEVKGWVFAFLLMLVFIISKEGRVRRESFLARVELEAHAEQRRVLVEDEHKVTLQANEQIALQHRCQRHRMQFDSRGGSAAAAASLSKCC